MEHGTAEREYAGSSLQLAGVRDQAVVGTAGCARGARVHEHARAGGADAVAAAANAESVGVGMIGVDATRSGKLGLRSRANYVSVHVDAATRVGLPAAAEPVQ